MGALHVWSNNYTGKYTYIGHIESKTDSEFQLAQLVKSLMVV